MSVTTLIDLYVLLAKEAKMDIDNRYNATKLLAATLEIKLAMIGFIGREDAVDMLIEAGAEPKILELNFVPR